MAPIRLIAFVNESKNLTKPELAAIAEACNRQLVQACKDWDLPSCMCYLAGALGEVEATCPRVVFLDHADQADALGYHSVGPDGRPYARVFVQTVLEAGGEKLLDTKGDGNTVSCCASHEVLELLVDPSADAWAPNGMPTEKGSIYALESADPVQGYSYTVHTKFGKVSVSDYVLPQWFGIDKGNPDKFDHLHLLKRAWDVGTGGYIIVKDEAGNVGQLFGCSRYPHASSRFSHRQESAACSPKDPVAPTSGSSSNASLKPGKRSPKAS